MNISLFRAFVVPCYQF